MDQAEIRLRLIEAAARNPVPHPDGFAAAVLAAARQWEAYVNFSTAGAEKRGTLTLPIKALNGACGTLSSCGRRFADKALKSPRS